MPSQQAVSDLMETRLRSLLVPTVAEADINWPNVVKKPPDTRIPWASVWFQDLATGDLTLGEPSSRRAEHLAQLVLALYAPENLADLLRTLKALRATVLKDLNANPLAASVGVIGSRMSEPGVINGFFQINLIAQLEFDETGY